MSASKLLAGRPHYRIERFTHGWRIVVHRNGHPPQFIEVATQGEANQWRRTLDDKGWPGIVIGGA